MPDDSGAVNGPFLEDGDLAEGLLDRAFSCQDADAVIGPAADLAASYLQAGRDLVIPAALDDRDAAGTETSRSRQLRRLLAARLLGRVGAGAPIHRLLWGWRPSRLAEDRYAEAVRQGKNAALITRRGLLVPADLRWAQEAAAAARPEQVNIWIPLLRAIYDSDSPDAQDAAWQSRETPLWPAFASWFDPVVLGSAAEAQQRSIFESTRPRSSGWGGAPAHTVEVLDLYQRAATESGAFLGLIYVLQVDPVTGRGMPPADDDLASRPGIRLLPPDAWPKHLQDAAWNYLQQGASPGPEILDTPDRRPFQAQAGYLALAFLLRHELPGRPKLAEGQVLARWAPSILASAALPARTSGADPKRILLARLAEAAPGDLPGLIDRLIQGHLAAGAWPDRLEPLDAAFNGTMAGILTRGLGSAATALAALLACAGPSPGQQAQLTDQRLHFLRRTLTVIAALLARHAHDPGIAAARGIISDATAPGASEARVHAARAAAVGLVTGDPRQWHEVAGQLDGAPDLLRAVLRDLADDPAPLMTGLTEDGLGELWELLARHWPYQADDASWSSGFIGPDQQAQHWRDAVLGALGRRGTADAVRVLQQLATSHPGLPSLADLTQEAEELRRDQDWAPVGPEDLTTLLEDGRTRLVRGSADLTDLIVHSIDEAASTLTRTGQLLWNDRLNGRTELWRPKSEPAVGAWLAEHLRAALDRSGVIVSREVRVRETTTRHGLAVDIQADAPVTEGQSGEPSRCRIELKGNWHPDLMTAMRTQLAEDYLIPEHLHHGIYLTAWFDIELWNDLSDHRRRQARNRNREATAAELAAQQEDLRKLNLDVRSVIIYIPRPVPSSRRDP